MDEIKLSPAAERNLALVKWVAGDVIFTIVSPVAAATDRYLDPHVSRRIGSALRAIGFDVEQCHDGKHDSQKATGVFVWLERMAQAEAAQ